MLEIALSALLAGAMIGSIKIYIRFHQHRVEQLRFHRDRFFETAEALIKDERLGDEYLERLKAILALMDNPATFGRAMKAVEEVDKEIRNLASFPLSKPPEGWPALFWDYLLAVSYSRGIRGVMLRNKLVDLIDLRVDDRNTGALDRKFSFLSLQAA